LSQPAKTGRNACAAARLPGQAGKASGAPERLAKRAGLGTQHGVFNRGQGHLLQGLQRIVVRRLAADDAERQISLQAVKLLGLGGVTLDEPKDRDPALRQRLLEAVFAQQAGMDQKGAGMAGEEAVGGRANLGELVAEHRGLI